MKAEVTSDQSLTIQVLLQSSAEAVTETLCEIRRQLNSRGPFSSLDGTWELVTAEVLNNIVEHAYADVAEGCGEIRISLRFEEDMLHAQITDYGRSMPDGTLPSGKEADLNVARDDLPEGGFGWNLILMLTSAITYNHVSGTNILTFELPLSQ